MKNMSLLSVVLVSCVPAVVLPIASRWQDLANLVTGDSGQFFFALGALCAIGGVLTVYLLRRTTKDNAGAPGA